VCVSFYIFLVFGIWLHFNFLSHSRLESYCYFSFLILQTEFIVYILFTLQMALDMVLLTTVAIITMMSDDRKALKRKSFTKDGLKELTFFYFVKKKVIYAVLIS
ncbi:hypothetical protein BY458DRAFT_528818, partial [Sporodiniella umbellata]